MTRLDPSRRQLLRAASALGTVVGTATPFALNLATMSAAVAQVPGDYKALVCLFMLGGNDHGNTVLATDPDSWSSYTELRGSGNDPITLAPTGQFGGVLPIAPITSHAGREFGLHPAIGRDTPDDVGRGRLLPEISVDQYGATLARWFGVSESLLDDVFPNLVNFGSNRNLGFML